MSTQRLRSQIFLPSHRFHSLFHSLLTLPVLLLGLAPAPAQAQLTADALIGDSVSREPSSYSDVMAAIKRFENRDVLGSRALLERARQQDPKLPPVDLLIGKMYILTRQIPAGRASLERTVRNEPDDPEPYLILAEQLYGQGRLIEAEALFDKALRLTDGYTANDKRKRRLVIRCRAGRAAVAEVRKDWETAASDLSVWVEVDPENASAHHRLGRALFLSGETERGFRSLTEARRLQETLPNPYASAAILYHQMGNAEMAEKTFAKAIESDRDNVRTLLSYSQWLIQSGNLERAEMVLARARRVEPDSPEVLTLSGVVAKMSGKRQPAEDYFTQALALAPLNRGLLDQLAMLFIEQAQVDPEKAKRALDFARMNAALHPDNSGPNITLAWVLYQLRQNKAANQALQKGLQLGNLSPDSRYLVAKMLVDQDRSPDAKQLLREALDDSNDIFVNRSDAQSLFDSLN